MDAPRRLLIYDYIEPTTVSLINHVPTPRSCYAILTRQCLRHYASTKPTKLVKVYPRDAQVGKARTGTSPEEGTPNQGGIDNTHQRAHGANGQGSLSSTQTDLRENRERPPVAGMEGEACRCKVARILGHRESDNKIILENGLCAACAGGKRECTCPVCRSPPFRYHQCTCPSALDKGVGCENAIPRYDETDSEDENLGAREHVMHPDSRVTVTVVPAAALQRYHRSAHH